MNYQKHFDAAGSYAIVRLPPNNAKRSASSGSTLPWWSSRVSASRTTTSRITFFERVAYEFLSLDWFVEENARRTDVSTFSDQDFSTLQAVDSDDLADDGTPLALSQARKRASHRRARADRGRSA